MIYVNGGAVKLLGEVLFGGSLMKRPTDKISVMRIRIVAAAPIYVNDLVLFFVIICAMLLGGFASLIRSSPIYPRDFCYSVISRNT